MTFCTRCEERIARLGRVGDRRPSSPAAAGRAPPAARARPGRSVPARPRHRQRWWDRATVGPEAMTSSGSPTTSDRMRLTTGAGPASRARPPPLICDRCLRTVFSSTMVAPQRRSRSVVCLQIGQGQARGRQRQQRRAAARDDGQHQVALGGTGQQVGHAPGARPRPPRRAGDGPPRRPRPGRCPAPGSACPYLVTTRPPLSRSPSMPYRAAAMAVAALPPPTTQTRSTRGQVVGPPGDDQPVAAALDVAAHRRARLDGGQRRLLHGQDRLPVRRVLNRMRGHRLPRVRDCLVASRAAHHALSAPDRSSPLSRR